MFYVNTVMTGLPCVKIPISAEALSAGELPQTCQSEHDIMTDIHRTWHSGIGVPEIKLFPCVGFVLFF